MTRTLSIARKEANHILRDRRSLAVAIVMPIAMLLIYGYGLSTELRDLPVGILDEDRTAESRRLVERMVSSGFIVDAGRLKSRAEVETGFRRGRYRAVLAVPRGFAESCTGGSSGRVQLLIDGSDATTAATVDNYLRAVLLLASAAPGEATAPFEALPLVGRPRVFFNPGLESANFIVPGLVAIVLVMIGALLTSIAIARERETGTMEQVLTTPVLPHELIVGKVLPYLVIASVDAALVLAAGRHVFGVPMQGSWWVLAGYSLLYLLIALSLGVFISSIAGSQRVAMMAALLATLLPTLILSGFIFPRSSMPFALRCVGRIVPATYYLVVIRGVMLKGRAWFPLEAGVMAGMVVVFLAAAVSRFRTRLE
jgi:ABC-2 type transport system permease protein